MLASPTHGPQPERWIQPHHPGTLPLHLGTLSLHLIPRTLPLIFRPAPLPVRISGYQPGNMRDKQAHLLRT